MSPEYPDAGGSHRAISGPQGVVSCLPPTGTCPQFERSGETTRRSASSRKVRARPSAGASGLGEAGDAVEGLAQAPGDLLVFPGKGVRNGHLDGHPRAAGLPGHQQRAPVAAEPGAVPGQPAGGGVSHEPAADVVVVAMGFTLQLDGVLARRAAEGGGGDPVREAARIRHEAPYGLRRRVDLLGLLEIGHCYHPPRRQDGKSIPRPGTRIKRPAGWGYPAGGLATEARRIRLIGWRIITSLTGSRPIRAVSACTAALPSSASGMATLATGTSRNARHSSSSKLTTDICAGTPMPDWRRAASTPNNWFRLPTPQAVGMAARPGSRVTARQPPSSVGASWRTVSWIPRAAHIRRAALTRRCTVSTSDGPSISATRRWPSPVT